MNFFTIKYDSGTGFADHSMALKDYGTPSVGVNLPLTHFLYIGNYKPFNSMYLELEEVNPLFNQVAFTTEYFDGTTWQPLEVIDETRTFKESNFIRFNKPIDEPTNSETLELTVENIGAQLSLEGLNNESYNTGDFGSFVLTGDIYGYTEPFPLVSTQDLEITVEITNYVQGLGDPFLNFAVIAIEGASNVLAPSPVSIPITGNGTYTYTFTAAEMGIIAADLAVESGNPTTAASRFYGAVEFHTNGVVLDTVTTPNLATSWVVDNWLIKQNAATYINYGVEGGVLGVGTFITGLATAAIFDTFEEVIQETNIISHKAWAPTKIDGDERYYIRLSANAQTGNIPQVKFKGLGVLFSNDMDLIAQRSNIVSKHNNGESWVVKHEEARKEIINLLRRNGHIKVKEKNNANENAQLFFGDGVNDLFYIDLTEFDVIDIEQLREASKYKTLALIYLNELSDENDDKYMRQGHRYNKKFAEAMNLFFLKLDLNDDGLNDADELNYTKETVLTWR